MIIRVALISSSRVGQVTFRISSRTPTRNAAGPVDPAGQPVRRLRHLHPVHGYFDSLCSRCLSQRGQYFLHSTRSGCFRLFLSVK